MRVYLAGRNDSHILIAGLFGGREDVMKIYLAGGISANLNPFFRSYCKTKDEGLSMKIFLAGGESRHWILTEPQGGIFENISCGRSPVERGRAVR